MELFLQIFILSFVEGLSEFLPVSSTAHLIVVGELLQFNSVPNKIFEVVIQMGAILPVLILYRNKLIGTARNIFSERESQNFTLSLIISFLPIAIIGFFAHDLIKNYLFSPLIVAGAMIFGGVIFLYADKIKTQKLLIKDLTIGKSLLIGLVQAFALIPGMSRSGSAIIGGLLSGMKKEQATEYSFFMAIPAVFAATFYDLYKNWSEISLEHLLIMLTGFVMSFCASYIVVRSFIAFVSKFGFRHFAYYRIIFGVVIMLVFAA